VTRILVYTGKGGVGKTSVAAATALMSARRGSRTIVLSTDIAHSLADAFGVRLGPEPSEVAPNLWGQEPDVYFNIGRYWRTIQAYMAELFSWRGLDAVMAEEMTVLPGMDELGNLLWIADHVESGKYDVIVVDAAPTGETLRLLSLPEASRWWLDRIAPIGRRVSRISRPVLERMIGVPIPRDEVFAAAERLLKRLEQVHRLLADPDRSSVRIVLGLEKLAIAEAQRSFTYFHLFGYPSDLVVCNRVLPPDVGGYFTGLRKARNRRISPRSSVNLRRSPSERCRSSTGRCSGSRVSRSSARPSSGLTIRPRSSIAGGHTRSERTMEPRSSTWPCRSRAGRKSASRGMATSSSSRSEAGAGPSSCPAP